MILKGASPSRSLVLGTSSGYVDLPVGRCMWITLGLPLAVFFLTLQAHVFDSAKKPARVGSLNPVFHRAPKKHIATLDCALL
jgi:hypothetical protein